VVAFVLGDRQAFRPIRLAGLFIGLLGVACIVGGSSGDGTVRAWNVAEVLIVAIGYSIAPFIAHHRLGDVPGIGLAAVSLTIVAICYLPVAAVTQDSAPTGRLGWPLV
jgi:drug/metabolite transporter (DMT)-like permease